MEAADDLPYVLQEAFVQKGPVVIDCPVDYRENLALTAKLKKLDSCMKPQACSEDLFSNRSLNRQNHVHPPLSP